MMPAIAAALAEQVPSVLEIPSRRVIPRSRIFAPTLGALLHVVDRMRPLDRREIAGLGHPTDPAGLCAFMLALEPLCWIAVTRDGEPAYAFGIRCDLHDAWSIGGFATARWPEVLIGVTGFVGRMLRLVRSDRTGRIVECLSLAAKTDDHRWLRALGAEEVVTCPNFEGRGEAYKLFAWR